MSAWIKHVKAVAKAKGIKFGEALKVARHTYKKGTHSPTKNHKKHHKKHSTRKKRRCRSRK